MSVKRSRTARSSSSCDVVLGRNSSPTADSPDLHYGARTAAAFSENRSAAARAAKLECGWPRPGILSVSSPMVKEELSQEAPIGNFLEKCCYCKKMIREKDEVFMYGHLQAFCTPDCRDKQIAMDNSRVKLYGGSSESRSDRSKMMNNK